MLKIGKSQIIMTSFVAVAFLGTLPAMAELGNVWTDFQLYTTDFRNYISNNISDSFSPVELQTQSAITNSSGDLNIPNPNDAAKSVQNQITQYSVSDKFESNPAVYGTGVSNEINRYMTRGSVEGIFGRDGQSRLKTKLKDIENTTKKVNQLIRNAEQANQEAQTKGALCTSTQGAGNNLAGTCAVAQVEIMQQLSQLQLQNLRLQADQSKIMAETLGNTIELRHDIQYSNLNLADISQQMNEVNRARRVDTSAEVARLLRVTSQTDLFRKSSASPSLESPRPSLESNPPSSENSPPPVLEPGQ